MKTREESSSFPSELLFIVYCSFSSSIWQILWGPPRLLYKMQARIIDRSMTLLKIDFSTTVEKCFSSFFNPLSRHILLRQ